MALGSCPDCGSPLSNSARSCPHCGKPITSPITMGCAIIAGFLLLLYIISSITTNTTPTPTTTNTTPAVLGKSIGDEARLFMKDQRDIVIGLEENDWEECVTLLQAKDFNGIALMVLSGRAIMVSSGTRVKIIDSSWGKRRIRILEGPFQNQFAWTSEAFIK